MKAIIIANGDLEEGNWWTEQVKNAHWIIAANGGAKNALRLDLTPDIVIGDLDSLDRATLEHLQAHGCRLIRHPARKDETDTELALKHAVELGATEVCVLGALGQRLDHALANILLLAMPELATVKASIVTRDYLIHLIRREATFTGQVGDTLSLLPWGGDVSGITTEGLEYPLQNGILRFGPARGVSNVLTQPIAKVQITEGLLLAIHLKTNSSAK